MATPKLSLGNRVMSCAVHSKYISGCDDCRAKCRTYFRSLRFYNKHGFRPCRNIESCATCSRLAARRYSLAED